MSKTRPSHIEDALVRMNTNQWFTWTDSKNKIYANLRLTEKIGKKGQGLIDNPVTEIPSESAVNAKLKELQDAWDLENTGYKNNRRSEYKSVVDQLDQLYHDMTADKLDTTGEWHKAIKTIKDKYAKG
jgi:hypothetical protein